MSPSGSSVVSDIDRSPLAGKSGQTKMLLASKDSDVSGDIGLFDDATEDEAVSSQYSSENEQQNVELQSQDGTTESETAEYYESDSGSEWVPDTGPRRSPPAKLGEVDSSPEEPVTVKKTKVFKAAMDPPDSPLQYKSKKKSGGADTNDLTMQKEHVYFDGLLDEGFQDHTADSTIIIPIKQARKAAVTHAEDTEYVPRPGEVDEIPKKKKR
ncbi:hypothetical protein K439DRAFT_629431 [Ramaria rubella]|nr:hypothetical protein K439DRAFT_629431 [Ramaria rubella]